MFCGKCGVKNADDAAFCTRCGAKLNGGQVAKNSTIATINSDKNRKVGIVAVGVIAVILIALIIVLFGGKSYKATVEKYINAQFDGDIEAIFELVPQEVVDFMMKATGRYDDLDEYIEACNEELQDYLDGIERYLGEGWSVSYQILGVENVTGDGLDELKDYYENFDIKVSSAKNVEVEFTIKARETETSNSLDISVMKVNSSWYLNLKSMGNILLPESVKLLYSWIRKSLYFQGFQYILAQYYSSPVR